MKNAGRWKAFKFLFHYLQLSVKVIFILPSAVTTSSGDVCVGGSEMGSKGITFLFSSLRVIRDTASSREPQSEERYKLVNL